MTTREKIIVAIMCLTIVYGAWELLGARRTGNKAPAVKSTSTGDLKSFVAEVARKLADEKSAKEHRYMIAQAGAPWTKDPFLQSANALKPSLTPQVKTPKAAPRKPAPVFVYTGYLSTGDSKLAIINGLEYAEGESLSVEDYYVRTILPNRVVIARINGPGTVQLPIVDMNSEIVN
jgi:hypothetical protein